ncbi:hypothetical protein BC941DRAFT_514436 [Chlamydoabsidia padenii]|nr:hypothetical protein BC941DRAFT_514436 [Chlamydoabsidia padenii]
MFTGTLLVVFMRYGWAFFLDCCLWWCMMSLCFWYEQLMARYDSLAEFFDYTPVELVEELQAVLEGQSF